jgi:hypothetical protein
MNDVRGIMGYYLLFSRSRTTKRRIILFCFCKTHKTSPFIADPLSRPNQTYPLIIDPLSTP